MLIESNDVVVSERVSNLDNYVEVRNLSVKYGSSIIINNLNVLFSGPGLFQVLGPNGAGKTTLLKAIIGLLKPDKGRILVNGIDVTGKPSIAGKYIGYVPQLDSSLPQHTYPVSVYEYLATSYKLRVGNVTSSSLRDKVRDILELVGLDEEYLNHNIWSLSGGERQRIFIARALIHNPSILLLDEPFSAVDPAGRMDIAKLLGNLAKDKLIIVTSHDPSILLRYTKKILLLNRSIYVYGSVDKVLDIRVLRKIYGSMMLSLKSSVHILDAHT